MANAGTKRFGAAVRVVRARYEIRQWRLAHRLEWIQSTMAHIETGRRVPTAAERDAIAAALADLAKRPVEDVVAMLEEEERR